MGVNRVFQNRLLGMAAVLGVAVTGTACSPGFILSWPTHPPTNPASSYQDSGFSMNMFVYDAITGKSQLRLKSIDGKVNLNLSQDKSGNQFTQCALGYGSASSGALSVSPDGRFSVFATDCAEIVGKSSAWSFSQVVLYDRKTATFELISQNAAHQEGNDRAYEPSVSNDGRYVVFSSTSTNLMAGSFTGQVEIFLKDRQLGTMTRVSVAMGGADPDRPSESPVISGNGKYIAFQSTASNYVADDTNNYSDVFLYEVATKNVTRISKSSLGEPNRNSSQPSISYDGSKILFSSRASNLVSNDLNNSMDVFLYDRLTQSITRVSTDSAGAEVDGFSNGGFISQDGKTIAFSSEATNLVPNDTNGEVDVFVKSLVTGAVTRVSVHESGAQSTGAVSDPYVSPDGRYIVFESNDVLVAADPGTEANVYVFDVQTGKLSLMDSDLPNLPANPEIYLFFGL